MIAVLLMIISGYIVSGIAVVLAINYGCIVREGRLRRISEGVPLVFGWPIVLFIMWAWKH
jgi:hypothetical protein